MHLAQTFIDLDEELNLTVLASELFHYMPFVPYKATNTRKFTLLLVSMKFELDQQNFVPSIFDF